MNEILKRAEECLREVSADRLPVTAAVEYPAMFIYVGERSARRINAVKAHLRDISANGGSILHAAFGTVSEDADISITADIPAARAGTVSYVMSDERRLSEFSAGIKATADKLMTAPGFPQMNKCFVFAVTEPGCHYNALLPELVILFGENVHIRVYSYLYTEFDENSEKLSEAAAFFKELSECSDSGFSYDTAMIRGGQRIPVHKDGPVFDGVFFLENYRSDMKFSAANKDVNTRIEALTASLLDREEPIRLPRGVFLTAGLASVKKPSAVISHVIYRSVLNILAGETDRPSASLPLSRLIGYDAVATVCDRAMTGLPGTSEILSVMPKDASRDPDNVKNTNVRSILDYYGGADKDYFDRAYRRRCETLVDNSGSIDIPEIFRGYINKGTLNISEMLGYLVHDGDVTVCMNEVSERLDSEAEELKAELDNILSEPCPGLSHGLFSRPVGCEILAAAVSAKYSKELELLRINMMKRITAGILAQTDRLSSDTAASVKTIKAFSGRISEEILHEIFENESTLNDVKAFNEHYARVTENAFAEFDRSGGMTTLLKERELYGVLMSCERNGTAALEEIAFALYQKLLSDPDIREIFAQGFDKELYARYRDSDGGKDPGWVDARLIEKLGEVSRANLRYSVFQPDNSLYCIGNGDSDFVRKMAAYEDPGFDTSHIRGSGSEPYEHLAIYNVPSPDSVVYVNECMKVYEGACAAHGDSFFIGRHAASERTL